MTVAFVVVSHSRPLAEAVSDLGARMMPVNPVPVEIAAGMEDGSLGTDAAIIQSAIERADEASQGEGVVVLLDLGSAVLSAEMACEMLDDDRRERVVISDGPLVEGLVVGMVTASAGGAMPDVLATTRDALQAKQTHMDDDV